MANHTMTKAELVGILLAGGINVSLYGLGKAKTLDHLLREVESGEAELRKDENGRLTRVTRVAKGEVLYRTPAGGLRLCEDRQVFTDCRERRRWADLAPNAVSEKLAVGEDAAGGIRRALLEELGIDPMLAAIEPKGMRVETVVSPSYPGLLTVYELYDHRVELTAEAYRPEGYVEVQEDKSTYFLWEEV